MMAMAYSYVVSYYVFDFFFYSFFHLLNLHSFPTRRSSDLLTEQAQDLRIAQRPGVARLGLPQHLRFALRAIEIRSEEHTSELQSLRHLVCRLLLEKKKKSHSLLDNLCDPAAHVEHLLAQIV